MVTAGTARCVLLINPELTSPQANHCDRDSHYIFGEVATAAILEGPTPARPPTLMKSFIPSDYSDGKLALKKPLQAGINPATTPEVHAKKFMLKSSCGVYPRPYRPL